MHKISEYIIDGFAQSSLFRFSKCLDAAQKQFFYDTIIFLKL